MMAKPGLQRVDRQHFTPQTRTPRINYRECLTPVRAF
jgi:hypothetical protein